MFIRVAKAIIDLSGESPGKAALLKMIGNVLIVSTMETVAEVSVLAEKTGIGSSHIQELISNYYKVGPPIYAKKMDAGDYYKHEVRSQQLLEKI
jgi:3-hydroxyisobutyrate dehydrogenase-like beta-hydroxyacid dehydrogenase